MHLFGVEVWDEDEADAAIVSRADDGLLCACASLSQQGEETHVLGEQPGGDYQSLKATRERTILTTSTVRRSMLHIDLNLDASISSWSMVHAYRPPTSAVPRVHVPFSSSRMRLGMSS